MMYLKHNSQNCLIEAMLFVLKLDAIHRDTNANDSDRCYSNPNDSRTEGGSKVLRTFPAS